MAGFAWDQPAVWGVGLSARPSKRVIYTLRPSFVPRHLLAMATTKSGTPFEKRRPNLQEHRASVSFIVYRLMLPSIVIGSEGRTVWITNSTACCSQVRQCYYYPSTQLGRVQMMPQHILLPPHENGSMEICANSILHSPDGRLANAMHRKRECFHAGGTRRTWYTCAEQEGKLKLRSPGTLVLS